MQNLINQLMQPQSNADGTLKPVSTLNRRAAQAIGLLHSKSVADTQARISLQREHEALLNRMHPASDDWIEHFLP